MEKAVEACVLLHQEEEKTSGVGQANEQSLPHNG